MISVCVWLFQMVVDFLLIRPSVSQCFANYTVCNFISGIPRYEESIEIFCTWRDVTKLLLLQKSTPWNLKILSTIIESGCIGCRQLSSYAEHTEELAKQLMFSTEVVNRMAGPDESIIPPHLRHGREPVAKKKKILHVKPKIDLLDREITSLKAPCSYKLWSVLECEQVIASYTNPVGKVTMAERRSTHFKA